MLSSQQSSTLTTLSHLQVTDVMVGREHAKHALDMVLECSRHAKAEKAKGSLGDPRLLKYFLKQQDLLQALLMQISPPEGDGVATLS